MIEESRLEYKSSMEFGSSFLNRDLLGHCPYTATTSATVQVMDSRGMLRMGMGLCRGIMLRPVQKSSAHKIAPAASARRRAKPASPSTLARRVSRTRALDSGGVCSTGHDFLYGILWVYKDSGLRVHATDRRGLSLLRLFAKNGRKGLERNSFGIQGIRDLSVFLRTA